MKNNKKHKKGKKPSKALGIQPTTQQRVRGGRKAPILQEKKEKKGATTPTHLHEEQENENNVRKMETGRAKAAWCAEPPGHTPRGPRPQVFGTGSFRRRGCKFHFLIRLGANLGGQRSNSIQIFGLRVNFSYQFRG